jgi:hypothetical protein
VPVETIADPRAAVRAALGAAGAGAAVLVTGSLFLVGEAYAELQRGGVVGPLFEPWNASPAGGTEAGP